MTKKKIPDPRNPIAPVLRDPRYGKRVTKSGKEREEQNDQWSKVAKHKKKNLDEFYQVGDKVKVINGPLKKVLDRAEAIRKRKAEGDTPAKEVTSDEGVVRIADGPSGTIGITIDGEYHLIDEEDVELLYEAFDSYEDLTEWSYAETTSGIRVPVSSEEQEILNMCSKKMYKNNLDDREQEVARRMVSRGVLHRNKDDGGIFFVTDNRKLTRF
jgi:hypothetical protein